MVRSLRVWCIVLVIGASAGCRRDPPPAPTKAADVKSAADSVGSLGKLMEQQADDLEKKTLSLLLDGVRDSEHLQVVQAKALKLITGAGSYSIGTRGGFGGSQVLEISPVDDVDAAAAKIDFGAILAVDVEKRLIVVDAGARAVDRPAGGWAGADAVRQFKGRKIAAWAAQHSDGKMFGPEKTVLVAYPGSTEQDVWADAIDARLKDLAKEHKADVHMLYAYPSWSDYRIAVVGPMTTLEPVVRALGADVRYVDEKLRVITLEASPQRP